MVYFPVGCIQNLLQMIMAHGFLHGGGSEGIVSRATGGVIWTILILVQNDREKKNERQDKNKNIADGPCTCGAQAAPKVAVP